MMSFLRLCFLCASTAELSLSAFLSMPSFCRRRRCDLSVASSSSDLSLPHTLSPVTQMGPSSNDPSQISVVAGLSGRALLGPVRRPQAAAHWADLARLILLQWPADFPPSYTSLVLLDAETGATVWRTWDGLSSEERLPRSLFQNLFARIGSKQEPTILRAVLLGSPENNLAPREGDLQTLRWSPEFPGRLELTFSERVPRTVCLDLMWKSEDGAETPVWILIGISVFPSVFPSHMGVQSAQNLHLLASNLPRKRILSASFSFQTDDDEKALLHLMVPPKGDTCYLVTAIFLSVTQSIMRFQYPFSHNKRV